ncbi:MAG: zinc-dependent peptidase [Deltaproteobacteria bacterium]|nr:zinc-dependent peptidase [Deltaproteobacteria bacterium]
MFGFKRRRRERIRKRPFPAEWRTIVERNVPYCRHLTEAERAQMRGLIQVFLAEKRFEGCGGLEITDEIRVTIAAQACLLLLGRDTDDYPGLDTILVYPHAFVVKARHRLPGGAALEGFEGRSGESWARGQVVLSWDEVLHGAADVHDGVNLVFHEFAHQLDDESVHGDGAPALPRRSMYIAWARVLGHEYQQLVEDIEHHRETVLRAYGATNPAEFFAVATEAFFETPVALRARHAELYGQLMAFYKQDPAKRCGFGGGACPAPQQEG